MEELSGSFLMDVLLGVGLEEEKRHLRKRRGVQNGHLHVENNALDQLLGTCREFEVQFNCVLDNTCDKTKAYTRTQDLGK